MMETPSPSSLIPTLEELEGLTSQCLARTFTDQQVHAIIDHSRQLASLAFSDYLDRESLRDHDLKQKSWVKRHEKERRKREKDKKDKKDKKKDKKKNKKKNKKKDKKKDKYRDDSDDDSSSEDELPWRPSRSSLAKGSRNIFFDKEEEFDSTHYVRHRLHEVRQKLQRKRERSMSNLAPCMVFFSGTGETKLDAQCNLLKKASSYALRSEQCWSHYLAKMDECLNHRSGEYCLRVFRPLEKQCAQSGWRSLHDLRKLAKLRHKAAKEAESQ